MRPGTSPGCAGRPRRPSSRGGWRGRFFFFKQKTAYEMVMSDWSSDVCSSDLFAWIVSAADAIDAMTSDRPYRKGMSLEVAIDQVREGAGTHFHPDVAEAVLDAAQNGTLKLIPQESVNPDAPAVGAFENPTG